jgi:hypothetical protein
MKWQKFILFCVCVLFGASITVLADDKVEFGFTGDFYSKYIWRGQVLDNKWVLQPSISASANGFTGSIWGNMNLTDESKIVPDNAGEFSEFDFTFDYTAAVPGNENLNFSLGTIYYRFPNQIYHPTTEVYAGLDLSDGFFSPSIKLYHDIDEIDGSYVQLGIGHTFEKIHVINEKCYCGLQLGSSIGWGSAGYNHGYFSVDGSGFNDLTVNLGFPFCIDSWTISPSINFSTMLDSDIRRATDKSDNIWIGVGLQKSF